MLLFSAQVGFLFMIIVMQQLTPTALAGLTECVLSGYGLILLFEARPADSIAESSVSRETKCFTLIAMIITAGKDWDENHHHRAVN